jgi:hypothetical protein
VVATVESPPAGASATVPAKDAKAEAPSVPQNGVDEVTVGNLVRQWQPELMYCYTEYGLRTHPTLSGSMIVRVVLLPNGSVEHTAFARRVWSGEGGEDVEACIRLRIAEWHFPPAAAGSAHDITLNFSR